MNKTFLLRVEMSVDEVLSFGACARFFDKTTRKLQNGHFHHPVTKTRIPVSNCYYLIKNVKNNDGIIIAKRLNSESPLLFTNQAFPRLAKNSEKKLGHLSQIGKVQTIRIDTSY